MVKRACARPCGVENQLVRQPGRNAHLRFVNSCASPVRFLAALIRWRSPFGPAFGCYSRWSLRLA
ncbi:hypothetical protein BVL52_08055 [Pseudomonas oryzihabitans]|uniref:DUF1534 domain-containing protein n=1 Tax=Pseudomonas oryzihabitans TaxID=47885 RepID=A0ABX3IV72_9PSED|nr:hypothetical protein BVL52_08055 [Pseudomonas psychrotolerans]